METIIGILALCAVMLGGTAWLLNRPGHPKDPREDEEQMEYLREWSEKHGKANRKEQNRIMAPERGKLGATSDWA